MPGVLALTYHVDYWDYLGWKDTLGSPDFSQRQYDYAKARGDMDVYTPQLIVNGGKPMVGSKRPEIFSVLKQSRQARTDAKTKGKYKVRLTTDAESVVGVCKFVAMLGVVVESSLNAAASLFDESATDAVGSVSAASVVCNDPRAPGSVFVLDSIFPKAVAISSCLVLNSPDVSEIAAILFLSSSVLPE